jgi:hypothetical protein
VTEQEEPAEFTWSWIREAPTRELSAHGRAVQARYDAGPPTPPKRPSAFKRLRFQAFLLGQRLVARRRSRGSVSDGGA